MKALIETNAYLRRPAARRRMLQHNALESSIFEGASCLHAEKVAKAVIAAKDAIVAKVVKAAKAKDSTVHSKARRPLSKAAAKKAVKGNASVTGGGLTSRTRRGGLLTGRCKPKRRLRRRTPKGKPRSRHFPV
jgi:hypothetical protein